VQAQLFNVSLTILSDIPNVFTYLDDILVASETVEQHAKDVDEVLSRLATNNLRLSLKKCEFFQTKLTFLGYSISHDGIAPPLERVAAIADCKLPVTATDLRRFLGMINFYRNNIPNFANIAFPVTELVRQNPKSSQLPWTDVERDSFNAVKQALLDCPTLAFPSPEAGEYHLVTDSSNYAVGAALYQVGTNDVPKPISFFSKKLSDVQKTYSTYDRELLAAFLAVLKFKTLIDGHSVTLFTDHKPLVSAFYSKSIAKSDRQQRQLSFLSEYVSSVQYIRGSNNVVADALSRPVCAIQADVFDLPGIAKAQVNDPQLMQYQERLTPFPLPDKSILWCDTSTQFPRPFVPSPLRSNVIAFLHNLSHPGFKNTSKLVKHRYFWPQMDNDIKSFVRFCESCQQAKVHRHTRSPVTPITAPSDRFQTVHIDIVGPLPPAFLPTESNPLPYKYLLTCIDRATRWTEAIPLIDTTTPSIAIAFVCGWIARFGVPLSVITDRGSQFESELFANLSSILGFHHIRTTAYHPQANGLIERHHRCLKAAIMARRSNWFYSLPIVLLGFRMTPNASGFSPFTAVTGTYMLCPRQTLTPDTTNPTSTESINFLVREMGKINFHKFADGDCHSLPSASIPADLQSAPKVWLRIDRVRKPLEAPYQGPFKVIRREPKFFVLELPQGETSVSIDRLKPARLPPPTPPSPPLLATPPTPTTIPTPDIPSSTTATSSPNALAPSPVPPLTPSPDPSPAVPAASRPTRSGRVVKFKQHPQFHYF
jgi:hypothetical protein